MCSVINIAFRGERTFSKEKVVYSKGNIYGKSQSPHKDKKDTSKNRKKSKSKPKQHTPRIQSAMLKTFPEMQAYFEEFNEEEERKKFIGNILKSSFTDDELLDTFEMNPNPKINKRLLEKKNTSPKQRPKTSTHPKQFTYQEDTKFISGDNISNSNNIEHKPITENDLRKTIRQYENNNVLQNKIQTVIKTSKILKQFNNKPSQQFAPPKKQFVELNDIAKDPKYIQATKDMKRYNENCEYLIKYTKDISETLKKDQHELLTVNKKINHKSENDNHIKAQRIINSIKNNIDPSNFDIETLNEKDKKLLMGRLKYRPSKRKKKYEEGKLSKRKEDEIKMSSSLEKIKKGNKVIKEKLNDQLNMEFKEEIVQDSIVLNEMYGNMCYNNFKRGKNVDINKIAKKTGKEFKTNEDIYDYIYREPEQKNEEDNGNDRKDKTFKHPFLIYD